MIMDFMHATDKKKFYARGIGLCDVRRDFEYWQSAKTEELAQAERPHANGCIMTDAEMSAQSDKVWAEIQAELAKPEVQAKIAAQEAWAKGLNL